MNMKSSILKSSFMFAFIRIFASFSSLLLNWVIARKQIDDLGAFRTIFIFFLISEFLPLLGMNQYVIREIARHKNEVRKYLLHSILFSLLVTVFIILVYLIFSWSGVYSNTISKGINLICISLPASAAMLCATAILFGLGKGKQYAVIQGGETLTRTFLGILLMMHGFGVLSVIALFVGIRWLSLIGYWKMIEPESKNDMFLFDSTFFNAFVKQVPQFSGIVIFFLINRYAPSVIIPWIRNDTEAGYFGAAFLLVDICLLIPTVFVISILPHFSRWAHNSLLQLKWAMEISMFLIFTLVLPVVLVVSFQAPLIVRLIYGTVNDYTPSVFIIRVIIWFSLINSLDQIVSSTFISSNRQDLDLKSISISAIVLVALTIPMTSYYAAKGASIVFLGSAVLLFIIRINFVYRKLFVISLVKLLWKQLTAGIIMAVSMYLTKDCHCVLQFLSGVLSYVVYLLMMGTFTETEKKSITELLNPQSSGLDKYASQSS